MKVTASIRMNLAKALLCTEPYTYALILIFIFIEGLLNFIFSVLACVNIFFIILILFIFFIWFRCKLGSLPPELK